MDDRHPREPFELMVSESIQRFHSDRRSGVSNLAGFSSIFSRIVQTTPDAPLEVLWFYSAVSFRSEDMEVVRRVSLVKELLGFMVSSSGCGSGLKRVAALAPVVYELHRLVGDVMFWFSEARDDVRCLIEGVVSYVSMCCYENEQGFSGMSGFSPLLMDVVSVWLADKAGMDRGRVGDLRLFFPMVSDEVRERISSGREVGFLAGSVVCEVFLLSLSLKCCSEAPRADLRKDLHQHAVQVIAGFRDLNFLDTLLRMLLEATLPVTHLVPFIITLPATEIQMFCAWLTDLLLITTYRSYHTQICGLCYEGYAGESLMREVLYDVAMTVRYPFIVPVSSHQLPGRSTEVALRWLLIIEKAAQLLRASGDDTKALSYLNAFFESSIPGQLIEWVIGKTGASRPVVSTPAALIRWLLAIEERGLQIFDDHLRAQVQGVTFNSAFDAETKDIKTTNGNTSIDQEMADSTNNINTSSLATTEFHGHRKRKEDRQDNAYLQAKFIKVHCHGNYVKEKFLAQW